jgi:integrase
MGAGIEWFTMAHMRHTAASLILDAGGTLEDVKTILGHTSIRMADELYAHLYEPRTRAIMDKLGEEGQRELTLSHHLA